MCILPALDQELGAVIIPIVRWQTEVQRSELYIITKPEGTRLESELGSI